MKTGQTAQTPSSTQRPAALPAAPSTPTATPASPRKSRPLPQVPQHQTGSWLVGCASAGGRPRTVARPSGRSWAWRREIRWRTERWCLRWATLSSPWTRWEVRQPCSLFGLHWRESAYKQHSVIVLQSWSWCHTTFYRSRSRLKPWIILTGSGLRLCSLWIFDKD